MDRGRLDRIWAARAVSAPSVAFSPLRGVRIPVRLKESCLTLAWTGPRGDTRYARTRAPPDMSGPLQDSGRRTGISGLFFFSRCAHRLQNGEEREELRKERKLRMDDFLISSFPRLPPGLFLRSPSRRAGGW